MNALYAMIAGILIVESAKNPTTTNQFNDFVFEPEEEEVQDNMPIELLQEFINKK